MSHLDAIGCVRYEASAREAARGSFKSEDLKDEPFEAMEGNSGDNAPRAAGAQTFDETEDQLRLMIDRIPILAWSCRLDGTTEFLNQRWLEYTGLSMQQALGWGWRDPIHPDDLGKLMDTWIRVLASEEPGEEEADRKSTRLNSSHLVIS